MQGLSRQEREKLARQKTIIYCAKKLFYTLGFEQTTMNGISEKSEYTIRTIYRYFANKEDLFYAVLYYDYQVLLEAIHTGTSQEDIGYKKICTLFEIYKDFSKNNTKFVAFTIRANEMIKDSEQKNNILYQKKYVALNKQMFNDLVVIFRYSQSDGSIRNDLDAIQLAVSSILTMTGFLNMLSATGAEFSKRYGLTESEIASFTFTRLLEILKPDNI